MSGKYSGQKNMNFAGMLYRYAVICRFLDFSEKLPSVSTDTFTDDELQEIKSRGYSEQRERLLLLCADGALSKKVFKRLFDSSADMLDAVRAAEEKMTELTDDENIGITDISMIEKALGVISFSKRYGIFTDIDFDSAYDISLSEHIKVDNDSGEVIYSERIKDIFRKLGEPLAWFMGGEMVSYDADKLSVMEAAKKENEEMELPQLYVINMSRLLFIIHSMDKLYGLDFIKDSAGKSVILLKDPEDIDRKYNEYLENKKLKFRINAYSRLRVLCGKENYNILDYRTNNISGGRIVSSSLVRNEKYSADEIKLNISDVASAPDEDEIIKKAVRKYTAPRVVEKDCIIEIIHESIPHWFVYKDTGDGKYDFCVLDNEKFMQPEFDYNEVFEFVMNESANKNIYRKNGVIEFKVEPSGRTSEFLEYAKNVLTDQLTRQAKSGQIARSLSERQGRAAAFAQEQQAKAEKQKKAGGGQANQKL